MRPLTIHFFTSYVHEQGTYFRYHNLARGLVQAGHAVTVFGCDVALGARSRTEVRDDVTYDIMPESWKASVFSQYNHPITALRRAARRDPPCDVAHLFQPFLGAAAAWRSSPARIRYYDWDDRWTGGLFSGPVPGWRHRWPRFITRILESRLPRKADRVTTVSGYLASMARERGARQPAIIPNGYWPGSAPDPSAARRTIGLDPEAFYVGFMGRTVAELSWCFEALERCMARHPRLRFALCGAPETVLESLPQDVRNRVDYLGHLSARACQDFAAAIDLGLLPLDDTPFNQSRYPIKFCDHLASGRPLLCSEVGEVGQLAHRFPWALRAGKSRAEWLEAFDAAVDDLLADQKPVVDLNLLAEALSWGKLADQLQINYRESLNHRL